MYKNTFNSNHYSFSSLFLHWENKWLTKMNRLNRTILITNLFCLQVCYVYHMNACRVRRGHQILQNWSYRWLGATMWMLGLQSALCKSTEHDYPLGPLTRPWRTNTFKRKIFLTLSSVDIYWFHRTSETAVSCSTALLIQLKRNKPLLSNTTHANAHTL